MQLVAPSAVTIAVAMLAIIWMMNLTVSFLLITHLLSLVHVRASAARLIAVSGIATATSVSTGIAATALVATAT